jgi:hypothetical protein
MTRKNSAGFKGRREGPLRMKALAGCMPKRKRLKRIEVVLSA